MNTKKGDEEIKKEAFYIFVLNAFMQIPLRIFYQYFSWQNELFMALKKKRLKAAEKFISSQMAPFMLYDHGFMINGW